MVPFKYRDNGDLLQGHEGFNKVSLTFHSDESATRAGRQEAPRPTAASPLPTTRERATPQEPGTTSTCANTFADDRYLDLMSLRS